MARVEVREPGFELSEPTLVEGLPGVGLVEKLATDFVVERLGMSHYATVRCPGLPPVVSYGAGGRGLRPPVRLYASREADVVALVSDVPVSPTQVSEFAGCVGDWLADRAAFPVYASAIPVDDPGEDRAAFGVATGGAGAVLDDLGLGPPTQDGVWSGPTGALLAYAEERGYDAVGVVVEADATHPDPIAAAEFIERVVNPVAGLDVDASRLREDAEAIRRRGEGFARRMNQTAGDDSSRAEPLRMFQ